MFKSLKEAATRADFPKLMSSGMKLKMMDVYNKVESEYERVVSFETSTKDKETYPSLSGTADPKQVLEGEAFKEDKVAEMQDVDITNYKFGRLMGITREMTNDDQTKKVKNLPGNLGKVHKNYENKVVFSGIVGGSTAATCYDGLAIFTTNHLNRKGGAAVAGNDNIYTGVTMSAGAIVIAMDMIDSWTGLDGEEITVNGVSILCSMRLSYTARWLMSDSSIPGFAAGVFGPASTQPFAGKVPMPMLSVNPSKWLTKVGGAALDWYIQTDVPGWVFQWRDKLELYAEGNLSQSWFEREVMRWKSRVRFGFKNIDWRAMLKVS